MASPFDGVIEEIIKREGDFSDHVHDNGGATRWGITEAVARANGYKGPMKSLPVEVAREIYMKRYIIRPAFDKVWAINSEVGAELIDTGVNMGPATAATFFQRALNAMNLRGKLFADLFVDGRLGAITLDAFRTFVVHRGPEGVQVMVAALNGQQACRYLEIAERNETARDFFYGWIRTRVLAPAMSE